MAVGGSIVTDASGVVAMVAMTPLITVQLMGLVAQLRTRKARRLQPAATVSYTHLDVYKRQALHKASASWKCSSRTAPLPCLWKSRWPSCMRPFTITL